MGLNETEAIILRTYNLAEADKIVVCLTRDFGVVRAVARGARRLKSRFGAGLEPFTIVAMAYYEKEGRELVSLRQAEILKSFFSLARSAEVVSALAYISELVIEFAPPNEPNEKIFRMIRAILLALAQAPADVSSLVRYFEVWILKLSGFFPDIYRCADCGNRFGDQSAIFFSSEFRPLCALCSQSNGIMIDDKGQELLRSAQRLPPLEFAEAARSLSEKERERVYEVVQFVIRRTIERRPLTQLSLN
ncbi:MAG TPA: DNA repair protein RecO [Pyrinomonadaceae bacterium]|nr:DNA repair protein RecO [Pyrinomonadaceae bacterium]